MVKPPQPQPEPRRSPLLFQLALPAVEVLLEICAWPRSRPLVASVTASLFSRVLVVELLLLELLPVELLPVELELVLVELELVLVELELELVEPLVVVLLALLQVSSINSISLPYNANRHNR